MNEIEEKELSEREELSYMITGAIYNCEIENKTLSFGYDSYYTLRQRASHYQRNLVMVSFELAKDAQPISGFVGSKIKDKQGGALIAGQNDLKMGQSLILWIIHYLEAFGTTDY